MIQDIPNRNFLSFESKYQSIKSILLSILSAIFILLFSYEIAKSQNNENYISFKKNDNKFTLSSSGKSSPICYSSEDFPGVIRVVQNLQTDIMNVTGAKPQLYIDKKPNAKELILIGTIGRNKLIDELVNKQKINIECLKGKWEAFLIQVVEKPFQNIERALIIAGSDKRGTIFGMYDLSGKIGVSPWNWWADVPVKKNKTLCFSKSQYFSGEPKVKYRGIFINDEAPALSGWVEEKYGKFNHEFYEKVFDLILRMKGNYLWPAMWGRSLFVDDTASPRIADEFGIVIGTSHHEPMLRAHVEWGRGSKSWNYQINEDTLKEFWREGIRRSGNFETIVTIGMRGDGDEPMSQESNIALLERIVNDQRKILKETTGKDPAQIPQLWALYKEVQEYYDKGMRVPDDVTLLLCDDNWGNIRKLPDIKDKPRDGGYGIYYHYDYVGDPRNYKWLNTNQISRVWEQMNMAYRYGANRIWIVNVGDIKPMEFPIEFFLDFAWDPDKWPAERLPEYTSQWAEKQFGAKFTKEIAEILSDYTRFNSRRKPELLQPDTYSLVNYREAEKIVLDYKKLYDKSLKIYKSLSNEYKNAYYQLILHPVHACSNLNEMYYSAGKNRLYAGQGRKKTNYFAIKVEELFKKDSAISYFYNRKMANGKWNHMMDQTHIGYTIWQQPDKDTMPAVTKIQVPKKAEMGIAIEGSDKWWPNEKTESILPEFDIYNQQSFYIEIFNRGISKFNFTAFAEKPWIKINPNKGTILDEKRIWISVDWKITPTGKHKIPILIKGANNTQVKVYAIINNPETPKQNQITGFIESNGYVSIEAEHYDRSIKSSEIGWLRIPGLGRTLSGIIPVPVTASAQKPGGNNPRLEYDVYLFSKGDVKVKTFLSPTLNFPNKQGLQYAISFDDEIPQIININKDTSLQGWKDNVSNNINIQISNHNIKIPGLHVLKYWMVDPGIVVQKIVIETGEVKPCYLGPPESIRGGKIKYSLEGK